MPIPRTTSVLFTIGSAIVLYLAIVLLPQQIATQQAWKSFRTTQTDSMVDHEGGYGDGKTSLDDKSFGNLEITDSSVPLLVIGIELGRAYSRVGIVMNGTFELIADDQGCSAVPSYVAFTNQGLPLVGYQAMDQATSNILNTIYDMR